MAQRGNWATPLDMWMNRFLFTCALALGLAMVTMLERSVPSTVVGAMLLFFSSFTLATRKCNGGLGMPWVHARRIFVAAWTLAGCTLLFHPGSGLAGALMGILVLCGVGLHAVARLCARTDATVQSMEAAHARFIRERQMLRHMHYVRTHFGTLDDLLRSNARKND